MIRASRLSAWLHYDCNLDEDAAAFKKVRHVTCLPTLFLLISSSRAPCSQIVKETLALNRGGAALNSVSNISRTRYPHAVSYTHLRAHET